MKNKNANQEYATMRCPLQDQEIASILPDYCDRTLSPEMEEALESHFELCSDCRDTVKAQRAVWAALDEFKPDAVTPGFNDAVLARIAAESRPPWSRLLAWPDFSARPAISMAAAAMVLIAVALFQGPTTQTPAEVDDSARYLKSELIVDVEQVDSTLDDIEMLRQLGLASPADQPQRL